MGRSVKLNSEEKKLKVELEGICEEVWQAFEMKRSGTGNIDIKELYEKMANKAHELHMSLKNRRIDVKHHKYMLENRGCSPEDLEFYRHIHPVEDLLEFIEDTSANDDPVDKTIGEKFTLRIYTRRWGHDDVYYLSRSNNGWHIETITNRGESNKGGYPVLFDAFKHDGVCYPKQTGEFLEFLWDKAKEDGLDKAAVQKGLDDLGKWISKCEKSVPKGVFKGLI